MRYPWSPERDGFDLGPLKDLLKTFSYRPNWSFKIDELRTSLIINCIVMDADDFKKEIVITHSEYIPLGTFETFDWAEWLRGVIIKVEIHEVDEFFRIGNKKPFYPH